MRSATEPTLADSPHPAGPRRPPCPGRSDRATLPLDTAAAAGDQEVGEHPTPESHAALSSATADLPCWRREQADHNERATPPANATHGQTPSDGRKRPQRTARQSPPYCRPPNVHVWQRSVRTPRPQQPWHPGPPPLPPMRGRTPPHRDHPNHRRPRVRRHGYQRCRCTSRVTGTPQQLQNNSRGARTPHHTHRSTRQGGPGATRQGPPKSTWLPNHRLSPNKPRLVTPTRHAPHLPQGLRCKHTMTPATRRPPPMRP